MLRICTCIYLLLETVPYSVAYVYTLPWLSSYICGEVPSLRIVTIPADVDECSMDLDDCHFNALCSNIEDGFMCTCKSGYTGNGTDCTS